MQTSYELIQATKGVISKKPDAFLKFMELTTSDMFFQVKFVVCDDAFVNQELTALYKYFKKNFFLLENPNGVAEWINGVATEQSDRWLLKNKRDQLDAEKKGTYTAIPDKDALGPGLEIESIEYTQVLVDFLCKLPEIIRLYGLPLFVCYIHNLKQYLCRLLNTLLLNHLLFLSIRVISSFIFSVISDFFDGSTCRIIAHNKKISSPKNNCSRNCPERK